MGNIKNIEFGESFSNHVNKDDIIKDIDGKVYLFESNSVILGSLNGTGELSLKNSGILYFLLGLDFHNGTLDFSLLNSETYGEGVYTLIFSKEIILQIKGKRIKIKDLTLNEEKDFNLEDTKETYYKSLKIIIQIKENYGKITFGN